MSLKILYVQHQEKISWHQFNTSNLTAALGGMKRFSLESGHSYKDTTDRIQFVNSIYYLFIRHTPFTCTCLLLYCSYWTISNAFEIHADNNYLAEKKTYVLIPSEPGHEKMCLMPYANNKGVDQPAHLGSLISAFVVCCLDSVMSLDSVMKISSLMLASVAEQASLNPTCSKIPEDTFSCDEAHLLY